MNMTFLQRISHAMSSVLDSHAPIQMKKLSSKTMVPWFNNSIKRAITKRRRFERLWRKDKIEIKRQMLRTARNEVSYLIEQSKRIYYNDKIINCEKDQKKLFEVINDLMSRKEKTKLPSGSLLELVNAFNKFFITKIENIRFNISSSHNGTSSKHGIHCPHNLSEFDPVTEEELMKIIQGSKNATYDLDPFLYRYWSLVW